MQVLKIKRDYDFKALEPAPAEQKGLTVETDALGNVGYWVDKSVRAGDTVRAGVEAYLVCALAYICIRYRASNIIEPISGRGMYVVEEDKEGEHWVESHAIDYLLENPNVDQDLAEIFEETQIYLDTTGSALWVKSKDRLGRPGALYAFSGEEFAVTSSPQRRYARYRIDTTAGPKYYPPEEVVYLKYTNPSDRLKGFAPLSAALSMLNISQTLQLGVRNALLNSAKPSAVVELSTNINPEQFERVRGQLNAFYSGTGNAGKTVVLENGKWQQLGVNYKDLALGEIYRQVESIVCACFGIPPELIPTLLGSEHSTYNNKSEAKKSFYDETIFPLWAWYERKLTKQLLRDFDTKPNRYLRIDKERVRALQADLTKRSGEAAQNAGIWSINERRIWTGKEPIEGDEFDRIPAPAAAPAPAPAPAEVEDAKSTRSETETKAFGGFKLKRIPSALDLEFAWKLFEAQTDASGEAFELAVAAELRHQADQVSATALRTLREARKAAYEGKPSDESVTAFLDALKKELATMTADFSAAVLYPYLDGIARKASERIASQIGISFELFNESVASYLGARMELVLPELAHTTFTQVRDNLQAGLKAGETIPQLTKRLQGLPAFNRDRARLVARTETIAAHNTAPLEGLKKSGLKLVKTWITAKDHRVRDSHAGMEGETVEISKPFSNGMDVPNDYNERCTVYYSEIE